jgi:hypothetical protein
LASSVRARSRRCNRFSAIAAATISAGGLSFVASLPALAQGERAAFVADQCLAELGLTEAECACVIAMARTGLSARQIDYLMVRIAADVVEVERMRTFMPLGERLAIFFAVQRAAGECAPGKRIEIPS